MESGGAIIVDTTLDYIENFRYFLARHNIENLPQIELGDIVEIAYRKIQWGEKRRSRANYPNPTKILAKEVPTDERWKVETIQMGVSTA